MMDCSKSQELTLDGLRGKLPEALMRELEEHRSGCVDCQALARSERALTEALELKLPRYSAPVGLRRRLAESWPVPTPARAAVGRWSKRTMTLALAGGLSAAAALIAIGSTTVVLERRLQMQQLEGETLNDHLRILGGAPLAQVTGGLHEVKPWFGGRLDFAPLVRFAGNSDFPLQGGAVEPFLDRRAAVFVYKRRLHTATLFVVTAQGLAFPTHVATKTLRGFNLALWRDGEQGYALVSDLNLPELLVLQSQVTSH